MYYKNIYCTSSSICFLELFEVLSNKTLLKLKVSSSTILLIDPVLHTVWVTGMLLDMLSSQIHASVNTPKAPTPQQNAPIFFYNLNAILSSRSISNVTASMMRFQITLKRISMLPHLKYLVVYSFNTQMALYNTYFFRHF